MRILIILVFLFSQVSFAQEFDIFNSVVSIEAMSINGAASGTGVVIHKKQDTNDPDWYQGNVVTANHVVENSTNIIVSFFNDKRSVARLVEKSEPDIAILALLIPKEVFPIEIGEVEIGQTVILVGKPRGNLRFREGKVCIFDKDKIYIDSFLIPGDSGGPILFDGKLVGVNSGGWFWLEKTDKTSRTWPASGPSYSPIRRLLEKVK